MKSTLDCMCGLVIKSNVCVCKERVRRSLPPALGDTRVLHTTLAHTCVGQGEWSGWGT
jgi:hypothetical protein